MTGLLLVALAILSAGALCGQTQYTASFAEQAPVSDQAAAQIPNAHYMQISWTDGVNPAGTAYNVYRSLATASPVSAGQGAADTFGACSRLSRFVVIATVATLSYIDRGVTGASYCYIVTAVYQGAESPRSTAQVATGFDSRVGTKAVQVQ